MNETSLPVVPRGLAPILAGSFLLGLFALACQNSEENAGQDPGPLDAAPSNTRVDAARAGDGGVSSSKQGDASLAADAKRVEPADTNHVVAADARSSDATDSALDVPAISDAGVVIDSSRVDSARSDSQPSSYGRQDRGQSEDGASSLDGSSSKADSSLNPDLSPACQSILVDNSGPPTEYPVLYREEANAQQTFEAEKARLQSTFNLTETDYQITTKPITWAAKIQKLGAGQIPVTGPVDKTTTPTLALRVLSDWAELFKAKGVSTTPDTPTCFNKFCRVILSQDYCGFTVASDDINYTGNTPVFLYATTIQAVSEIDSHFVPTIPMPRNVLLTDDEVKEAVVGQVFTFFCATGERSVTVTSQDEVNVPSARSIYVRKSTAVASALEYRLVIPTVVEIGILSWITYVDGIDGTVVASVAQFVCD